MENEAIKKDEKSGTNYALVRVQAAIVHVETRMERAEIAATKMHNFREATPRSLGSSTSGFLSGRRAGRKADLQGHKRKGLK